MRKFPYEVKEFASMIAQTIEPLVNAIDKATSRGEFTDWTRITKEWLRSKASEKGLRATFTVSNDMSEFLVDLVWWPTTPGGSAVLACEMEWGNTRDPRRNPGRVAEDFDKLLSFKAPFKLMLFDSYSDVTTRSEVIKELDNYLSEYDDHRAGEQYLVMDMSNEKSAWICDIVQDGEDKSLKLTALPLN